MKLNRIWYIEQCKNFSITPALEAVIRRSTLKILFDVFIQGIMKVSFMIGNIESFWIDSIIFSFYLLNILFQSLISKFHRWKFLYEYLEVWEFCGKTMKSNISVLLNIIMNNITWKRWWYVWQSKKLSNSKLQNIFDL